MTSPSARPNQYQNEPIWSRSEEAIARKAFDAALKRELHEIMQEAKAEGKGDERTSGRVGVGTVLDPTS
jgi:hypothetical protein